MSQLVGELVRSGPHNNLMSTHLLMWESTTTAGTRVGLCLTEFGALPLTQISNGSYALSQDVMQHTNVKSIRLLLESSMCWVLAMLEIQMSLSVEELVKLGHPRNLMIMTFMI